MANHARAIKTIGILTSGGDCAGLNAVIRAVVSRAPSAMAGASSASARARWGCCAARSSYEVLDLRIVDRNMLRLRRHDPRHHQQGRPLRLPDAGRQPARPLGRGHRGLSPARPRRADRHRRRRQLRHTAPARRSRAASTSSASPRRSTTMSALTESSVGYRHRGRGRDRGARPAAADRGEPRPGDDPRGDGARCRAYRARRRHRRRRRCHPDPRDPLHARGGRRAYRESCAQRAAISRWSSSPKRCRTATARSVHRQHARRRARPMAASAISRRARSPSVTGAETRVTVLGHVQRGGQPIRSTG